MIAILISLMSIFGSFVSPSSAATKEDENISLSAWVKTSRANAKLASAGIPVRAAILKRVDRHYVPVNFDFETTKTSFLDFPRFEQNQLTFEINKVGGQNRCSSDIASAARCLEVGLVLDVSSATWNLLQYDRSKNKVKNLLKAPAADDGNYVKWIASKLNYDGIIIDTRNNYRLALVPPTVVAGQTQVLLMEDGAGKVLIEPGANKGAGLLLVKKASGRFAILEMIIAQEGKAASKLGDKILIEKAKASEATE